MKEETRVCMNMHEKCIMTKIKNTSMHAHVNEKDINTHNERCGAK